MGFARKLSRKHDDFKKKIRFRCTECGFEEDIPKEVVDYFDIVDGGDPTVPPRFDCQLCNGQMEPVEYTNHDGIVYKLD